jgi:hypothetical protein
VNSGKLNAPHPAERPLHQASYRQVAGCRYTAQTGNDSGPAIICFDFSTWKKYIPVMHLQESRKSLAAPERPKITAT